MSFTILQADSHKIPLAANSVQCVVTSPPYWGLRDYGTATWVGGAEGCDHSNGFFRGDANADRPTAGPTRGGSGSQAVRYFKDNCGKCGATRIDSQIGLEPTPEEYVKKIVAVFAEVWRVLRDDGTCWVNLGDSYSSGSSNPSPKHVCDNVGMDRRVDTLAPKNLVGIPWRVAFALQAAGWYLRSDIIWSKPNPMPESVTDRPTKAHEYIFLLSKRERYYFDQDAVREPHEEPWRGNGETEKNNWSTSHSPRGSHETVRQYNPAGRNIRTVWEIATQPYPDAHFATFPEEIAKRCILAGTSEKGACKECGAPMERVTDIDYRKLSGTTGFARDLKEPDGRRDGTGYAGKPRAEKISTTTGWIPSCSRVHRPAFETQPCVVLDPFSGAGTVPLVADKLNRRGIGLELKWDYVRMAHERCYDDAPLLAVMEG